MGGVTRRLGIIIPILLLAVLLLGAAAMTAFVKGATPSVLSEQRDLYSQRQPPGGRVYKDIRYKRGLFNRHNLDIYMPTGRWSTSETDDVDSSGVPAVVFVHGGSWMHGSKEDIRVIDRFLEKMRSKGWAVISVDYVTIPVYLLEGPSSNVARAFDWIHRNAGEYGIDPTNIGIYSVSAGSHLAMEAMVRDPNPQHTWRFWLNECGPVDLVAMADGEAYEDSERLERFSNRYLRKHSPILYVSTAFPPTAIAHGDLDRTVSLAQSERLAEVLSTYGTPVFFQVISGGNHGFFNMSQADWSEMEDSFIPFMESHFRR